jgi:D-alanyl-D-alanine carboxypeptidase
MINKFLYSLIFALFLVLPAYPGMAPEHAPAAGKATTAAAAGPEEQVIVIVTAKDPKVDKTTVGKHGEIIVPQSTVSTSSPVSFTPSLGGRGRAHRRVAATKSQDSDDDVDGDKSADRKVARAGSSSLTSSTGGDRSTGNNGQDQYNGGLSSGASANNGGYAGGGVPYFIDNSSPSPAPVPPTLPSTQLQTFLNQSVSDAGVPGAIALVRTKWGTWIGAAGKADLAASQPLTTDMQVRLAGVTKLFTASLIMRLVEDGKLALTDTVEKWLPGQVISGDQITVNMLLNHTSGLHDHESTSEYRARLLSGPTTPWTAAEVLGITNSYPLDFDPGTSNSYCNTGYYILGMIIEAATGNKVEDLIQAQFFGPLGLTRTALTPSGLKVAPYGLDYCWFGNYFGDPPPYDTVIDTSGWDLSWDWTSGSAVTTAQDILTWTKALFGGQVVNYTSLLQMVSPQAPAATYGFGLQVMNPDPWFGVQMYYNSAINPGVLSRWLYYPDSGRIIFLSLNRADKSDPPQVDASTVANNIVSGLANILISTNTQ